MTERLTLREPTPAEYAAYRIHVRDGYAEDLVTNGGHERDEATEKAERDTQDLLPEAGPAEGQVVRIAEVDGRRAGFLWVGRAQIPGIAWVNDVEVDAALRGQGLGRELMQLAEQLAAGLGYERIGLNVMGGNTIAIGLYESLGYTVMHQQMAKPI